MVRVMIARRVLTSLIWIANAALIISCVAWGRSHWRTDNFRIVTPIAPTVAFSTVTSQGSVVASVYMTGVRLRRGISWQPQHQTYDLPEQWGRWSLSPIPFRSRSGFAYSHFSQPGALGVVNVMFPIWAAVLVELLVIFVLTQLRRKLKPPVVSGFPLADSSDAIDSPA